MECTHITSGSYCKICSSPPEKKKPKPLAKVSKKNTVQCSDGQRLSRLALELNIKLAKILYREKMQVEGKYYCEVSGVAGEDLDTSHIVSVDDCIKQGKSEHAYNDENLELLTRKEHEKWEREKNPNEKRTAFIKKYFPELEEKYKPKTGYMETRSN